MQADEVLEEERSGGGGGVKDREADDLDEFIELVARANHVPAPHPSSTTPLLLPQLRASPCAMHQRHLPAERRDLDLLYNTSCHGGKVVPARVKVTGDAPPARFDGTDLLLSPRGPLRCSLSDDTPRGVKDKGGGGGGRRRRGRGQDTGLSPPRGFRHHAQHHVTAPPPPPRAPPAPLPARLPAELPPGEVVMTWLQHGSAPVGESHFPAITQPANRIAARRRLNQSSAVSE